MPFHLAAFDGVPASAALTLIAGVADPSLTVNGNNITVPQGLNNIVGLYAAGLHITRAQVQSPSLRRIVNHEIAPVDVSATPQVPERLIDMRADPRILNPGEFFNAAVIDATASEHAQVFAWLADGPIQPVSGQIVTVRATATTTLTANAWTNCAITFDQVLPGGTFQLVGMRGRSTGMIAFRVVPTTGSPRPGAIGNVAASDGPDLKFRMGSWGVWITFTNIAPPTVDVFSGSADTAETFEMDLIQIA